MYLVLNSNPVVILYLTVDKKNNLSTKLEI